MEDEKDKQQGGEKHEKLEERKIPDLNERQKMIGSIKLAEEP